MAHFNASFQENGVFQPKPFLTMIGVDIVMVVSFSVAIALGARTFYHIRRADTISTQFHILQWKLFVAVCAQTFVPLVFVYIPYAVVINAAFFGLPVLSVDDAFMVLTSCFPAWDAVVIILLMADYSSLPKDIRWKVFSFLQESVGELRLVSKSWLAMVDEWAIPDNLPALLKIHINEVIYLDTMNVVIEFRRSDAACFGRLRELSRELNCAAQAGRNDPSYSRPWNYIPFFITYESPNLYRLRDAISAKSRFVDITMRGGRIWDSEREYDGSSFHEAIVKLLASLKQVAGLRLYPRCIDEGNAKMMMHLMSHISVHEVDFAVDIHTFPRDILVGISERVACIRIRLQNSHAENPTITTSFRDKSASWIELILSMFHVGARSIELSNYFFDLFSSEDISSIAETLVSEGTPFHMKVILHERPELIVEGIQKEFYQSSRFWIVNIAKNDAQIFLYLDIIFGFSMALHCLSLYLLIMRTPQNQMVVRNYLIIIQVLLIIHDVHLDVGIHPIIVLQALGGYGTGWLLRAGVPMSTTFVLSVDDAFMVLTSCFPAWDAVVIILLMADYRDGLLGMFRKKNTTIAEPTWKSRVVAGVSLNLLLLFAIRRFTKTSVGSYKDLLSAFASYDIFLSMLHAAVKPRAIIIGSIFGISSLTEARVGEDVGRRLKPGQRRRQEIQQPARGTRRLLCPPPAHILLSRQGRINVCRFLLCMYGLSGQTYDRAVEIHRTEFELRYEQNVTEGWIIMNWQNRTETARLVPTLLAYDIIMAISLTLAVMLGILTFNGIRRTWKVSRSKANLQLRLFIAVIAQTLVPFVCVYFPYFCVLTFTPLRLPVSGMADLCFFLTSCFPAWDAVIIITLMTDYRHAVTSQFSRFIKPATLPGLSQMTTMAWSRVGIAGSSAQPSMWRRETTTVMGNLTFSSNWVCGTVSNRAVSGVSLNLILLFAIRRFTKTSVGSYKYLLTAFASYDIFLSVLHAAVKPRPIIIGSIFGVTSLSEDRRITSVYCACFTVPFALMIIHFLYRFWSIRYPHLIALFSNKRFVAAISTYPVLQFVEWYMFAYYGTTGEGPEIGKVILSEESARRFEKGVQEGWLIFNYWENGVFQPKPFLTMIGVDIVMVVSFSVAIALGARTFYHIRSADTISTQFHILQWKLFVAVCAQTFVPLVFVYIPYAVLINAAFFGLPVLSIDDAFMVLTSCFPAWDAVVIILLMADYRDGLLGMFRKKKTTMTEPTWKSVSTVAPPSSAITSMCSHPQVLEHAMDSLHLDYNSCFLSRLLKDIRWKVFSFLQEYVGELRLVSKSWLAMVDEWAIPGNLPALLNIHINEVIYLDTMNVVIEFSRSDAACFGRLRELSRELNCAAQAGRNDPSYIFSWNYIALFIPYDSPNLYRLRDAISAKSRLVDITMSKRVSGNEREYYGSGFYKAVSTLLAPLKQAGGVRMYPQYIDEENAKMMMDLMSRISIREVDFVVHPHTFPRDIIIDISERVACIRISLHNSQAENLTITISFRDRGKSWIELILCMFHAGAHTRRHSIPFEKCRRIFSSPWKTKLEFSYMSISSWGFSMALHFLSLYLLVKRTPQNQMTVRNYLIIIQVLLVIHDVHHDFNIQPIIVIPALGGYGTGWLLRAGVPLTTAFSEARILLYLHIIFCFSLTLHSLSLYLLIRRTPPNQMLVRNYLIVIQVLLIVHDTHLDVGIHPIIVLQALGGYGTGLLLRAGVPLSTTFQTITLVHAGMSITSPIPVIIWMVTCHDQAMSERLLVEDPRNITWIRDRGYFYIEERVLILFTSICVVIFLHMFYTLRIDAVKRSSRSIKFITRSLLNLFAQVSYNAENIGNEQFQLVIPLLLFVVPTLMCAFAVIFPDFISFETNQIVYVIIPTHSIGHNLILLSVNSTYRKLFTSCNYDDEM
ncbi:hypothetical protein PRIPAC_77663 [Pristionchus pacificus]|uniref:G protein-coupled receptor n=1 Tax=Pristionchus pacificus TaxID=54126 RepID=A0A2A6CMX8_PRIPA|nr:hypothetical protein PRIPAC_77663 [Pristionchus pacificus]|eukprot:PDM79381.1 G protein-coupled receptor [Pristionchus pacificus]